MVYLIIVSLIWAFSFGLIKNQLTSLDPAFVAFARLSIAFLVFIPLVRLKDLKETLQLLLIGAIQFGVMYVAYIAAFRYLAAYQIALLTILTPLYVTLLEDLLQKRFMPLHFAAALLSVLGTGIVLWRPMEQPLVWRGFFLMQVANICFAVGQVLYRRLAPREFSLFQAARRFAMLYLGAALISGLFYLANGSVAQLHLNLSQGFTLLYLGIIASGMGFFLWNHGATRVNAGTLAVFNNLKIPLAIAVSLMIFGEAANIYRLTFGGGIVVLGLWINEHFSV